MRQLEKMSNRPPINIEVHSDEPSKEEIALRLFDYLEIEKSLAAYLNGEAKECDIEEQLLEYAAWLAWLAKDDIKIYKAAFDRLTQSMNDAARKKFESPKPKSRIFKLRIIPTEREYVRSLDDRYWNEQFSEQHQNDEMTGAKTEDESDQEYTARYAYACMHGLLFAPFTYLP
jgi:hypothetical protein